MRRIGTMAVLALAVAASVAVAQQRRRPSIAPIPQVVVPRPENATACNYQSPQDFLIRDNWLTRASQPSEEQARRRGLAQQAVRYRTERYGYFEGFGEPSWNAHPPTHYARSTTFMGRPVRVNEHLVPLLACVEQQIQAECSEVPYQPERLSGIRTRNTYHNGEVSNHVYGIAIDVDPTLNTCCGCVAQWGDHPLCQREVDSIYDRMAMPACWVHVFERFGFYWLGRDRMQDTMHFEFLGDPEQITRPDPTVPGPG